MTIKCLFLYIYHLPWYGHIPSRRVGLASLWDRATIYFFYIGLIFSRFLRLWNISEDFCQLWFTCNPSHTILELENNLVQVWFATSKTGTDISYKKYLHKSCHRSCRATWKFKKLENNRKNSNCLQKWLGFQSLFPVKTHTNAGVNFFCSSPIFIDFFYFLANILSPI